MLVGSLNENAYHSIWMISVGYDYYATGSVTKNSLCKWLNKNIQMWLLGVEL